MGSRTYILADELQEGFKFSVIHERHGDFRVVENGLVKTVEELRDVQVMHKGASVEIDVFNYDHLKSCAEHYRWKLTKFRAGDFPYVGFVTSQIN